MAFQPVPDVIELFAEYRMPSGALVGNRLHVRDLQAGITGVRISDALDVYQNWFGSGGIRNWTSTEVSLVRLNGRDLTTEIGPVEDRPIAPPVAGTGASPALPAHTTIALSLRTGLAGRSARGRLYICGMAENMVVNDFVTTAAGNALLAAYQVLRTSFLAADFAWSVVQRVANGVPLSNGIDRPITNLLFVDLRVDTQRRRLVGEGN